MTQPIRHVSAAIISVIVIVTKHNITPFSGRMSHIHSPSSRSSTCRVLRMCSQGRATLTNPSSSRLALMRALAFAAINRRRLAHFFIPMAYNSPSNRSIFRAIMRCWYRVARYRRTSACSEGSQRRLTAASTSSRLWYLASKYYVSSTLYSGFSHVSVSWADCIFAMNVGPVDDIFP